MSLNPQNKHIKITSHFRDVSSKICRHEYLPAPGHTHTAIESHKQETKPGRTPGSEPRVTQLDLI